MLDGHELRRIIAVMTQPGISKIALHALVESVRANPNPHPAGQKQENVPVSCPVPGRAHGARFLIARFQRLCVASGRGHCFHPPYQKDSMPAPDNQKARSKDTKSSSLDFKSI
ncbi:hypothetical protein MMC22_000254 [Lobaria immixta]|nr:hypothetical protein [Lobaria immixta]